MMVHRMADVVKNTKIINPDLRLFIDSIADVIEVKLRGDVIGTISRREIDDNNGDIRRCVEEITDRNWGHGD